MTNPKQPVEHISNDTKTHTANVHHAQPPQAAMGTFCTQYHTSIEPRWNNDDDEVTKAKKMEDRKFG